MRGVGGGRGRWGEGVRGKAVSARQARCRRGMQRRSGDLALPTPRLGPTLHAMGRGTSPAPAAPPPPASAIPPIPPTHTPHALEQHERVCHALARQAAGEARRCVLHGLDAQASQPRAQAVGPGGRGCLEERRRQRRQPLLQPCVTGAGARGGIGHGVCRSQSPCHLPPPKGARSKTTLPLFCSQPLLWTRGLRPATATGASRLTRTTSSTNPTMRSDR